MVISVMAWRLQLESKWIFLAAFLSFIVGYAVNAVTNRIIQGGVGALFTCVSLEPESIRKHPELDEALGEKVPLHLRMGIGR